MLTIHHAKYIADYKIFCKFNNGKSGIADLATTLHNDNRALFNELKDLSYFQKFSLQHDTITWVNGLDLAPEYLFYLVFSEEPSLQKQFKNWGYV